MIREVTGAEIRAMRKRHNMTQAELAELINGEIEGSGLTQPRVARWEAGLTQPSAPARIIILRLMGENPIPDVQPPTLVDSWDAVIVQSEGILARAEAEGDAQTAERARQVIRIAKATKEAIGENAA